jgi:hypothetical protein
MQRYHACKPSIWPAPGSMTQAVATLQSTDYHRLPLLRRLLVNDRAINADAIKVLRQQQAAKTMGKGTGSG